VTIVNSDKNVEKIRHELVKIEFLREKERIARITLDHVRTGEMLADMLTKQLTRDMHKKNRMMIGLVQFSQFAKWGSIGIDFAKCEKTSISQPLEELKIQSHISKDSPERDGSNALGFVTNGQELSEIYKIGESGWLWEPDQI